MLKVCHGEYFKANYMPSKDFVNVLDEYLDQELVQEIHDKYIVINDDQ